MIVQFFRKTFKNLKDLNYLYNMSVFHWKDRPHVNEYAGKWYITTVYAKHIIKDVFVYSVLETKFLCLVVLLTVLELAL